MDKSLKIVFLDEYSIGGVDLTPIKVLGDYTGYAHTTPEQIVERTKDADILIVNKIQISDEVLVELPDLKLICVAATGMNNIDLDAAANAGVEVRNAVDYSTHSVAEQTFMGVLALCKQTLYLDDYVKSGAYSASGKLFHYDRPTGELHGKTWGIIGLGNIGRAVAQIAEAFGCQVIYYSTSGNNTNTDYRRVQTLDELLEASDVVSVHAPLSDATRGLIDYHQLSKMKRNAVIVNVARGGIINEEGLVRALDDGLIAGAALDVYSTEPLPADSPLLRVKDKYKMVLTPHSAWSTQQALVRLVEKIAGNIRDFFGL